MEGDKGRVEREQQGGQGDERGEVLVLKTALEVVEDMRSRGTVKRWDRTNKERGEGRGGEGRRCVIEIGG